MRKLEYSKSIGGELYPITKTGVGMGQLGFVNERKSQLVPNLGTWVWPLCLRRGEGFIWSITPLRNGRHVVACSNPRVGTHHMLGHGLINNNLEIFIEENDIPVYEEQVLERNQFEFQLIEGSPLFFHIKSSNNCYISAGVNKFLAPDPSCPVLCFLNENSKKYEYVQDYCSWYLAMSDVKA
ncbi:MAG: hypothetical protein EOP48_20025, partial [Sphingobacteriales bacterium]